MNLQSKSNKNKNSSNLNFLEGVIFALSGFINPERSELRNLGLKYGALYERDITKRVTHLIASNKRNPKCLKVLKIKEF